MNHYFILLELPGGRELKFNTKNKSPLYFWRNAVRAIRKGRVNLVCRRQDTGVSEALRRYMTGAHRFTTFVLTGLQMGKKESCDKKAILKKAISAIEDNKHETVIEKNDDFQIVTCDE